MNDLDAIRKAEAESGDNVGALLILAREARDVARFLKGSARDEANEYATKLYRRARALRGEEANGKEGQGGAGVVPTPIRKAAGPWPTARGRGRGSATEART